MENSIDDVLTIEELSSYLKISISTLYKLTREGKIPAIKIGRHWRFHKLAIDRWLSGEKTIDSVSQRVGPHRRAATRKANQP